MQIRIHTDEQLEALCEEHGVSSLEELITHLSKQYIFLIDDRPRSEYYEIEAQFSEENYDQFCHYED